MRRLSGIRAATRTTIAAAFAALAALGCAQQGAPPGGPVIKVPPALLGTTPDSGAVNVRAKDVTFTFDQVINERPAGATDLSQLVLISPRDGAPHVGWHRSTLAVHGHENWRPNTAYVVTLLPGIADLRGNTRKTAATVVFSTGATIPTSRISGVVFDWTNGNPIPLAAVEAVSGSDSTLVFIARADSTGRFIIPVLPPGRYTVRGYNDANGNRVLDPREAWDSAQVSLTDSAHAELLTFVHDTLPPTISQVGILDSVTLRVTFDRPLAITQSIDTSMLALKRADSTVVPVRLVEPAHVWDSTRAAAQPADTTRGRDTTHRADTAAARRAPTAIGRAGRRTPADTSKRAPPPKPSRPLPVSEIVMVVGAPLAPGASYRAEARNVKNLLGRTGSSSKAFTVPKPPPPPKETPGKGAPAKVGAPPRDTTTRRDTTHRDTTRRDSVRRDTVPEAR